MSRLKTTAYVFLSLLLWVLLSGCQKEKETHEEHAAPEETGAQLELSLNEGEKWPMDEHTRNSINTINAIFDREEPSTVEDYNAVGEETDAEMNNLIAGCTMEGAAHDQLHLFLGTFIPKVKALGAEKNIEEAGALYREIDQLLSYYDQYFE
jgi:hypothetical protein